MAKNLSKVTNQKVSKKVTKKSFSSGQGHGLRAESLLKKMIETGKASSIKGNAVSLERTIGASACKRLADFLEECLDSNGDGVGGIC